MIDEALQGIGSGVSTFVAGVVTTGLTGWFWWKRVVAQTQPALVEAQGSVQNATTGYLLTLLARQDSRIGELEGKLLASRRECDAEVRLAVRSADKNALARFQGFARALQLPAATIGAVDQFVKEESDRLELGEPAL